MAKPTNPLFSLRAVGSLARRLTFRRAGQKTIAESTPIHTDSHTLAQLAHRTMFQMCKDLWHTLTPLEQNTWETMARRQHMTGYAYYISLCLKPNPGIYLPLAGGTMTGDITMATHRILNLPPPLADEEPLRKVDGGGAAIPPGVIVMWSGLLANIPTGWHLCDGTDATPDLRSKFIKGAAIGVNPGVEGGANTHTHPDHPALTHSGAAVNAHSAHTGTAVANHSSKNTTQASGALVYVAVDSGAVPATTHVHGVGEYTHSVTQPAAHSNHTITQPSAHPAQAHTQANNEPVYYSLAFIIKL